MKKVESVGATIAGKRFEFARAEVGARLRHVLPEPIRDHFVVVEGKRYPSKQVLQVLTGLDRADFTTHQARAVLRRLGFVTGRLASVTAELATPYDPRDDDWGKEEADELYAYRGRWVVTKNKRVLISADTPEELLRWLEKHDETGDSLFRVPIDASIDIGALDV